MVNGWLGYKMIRNTAKNFNRLSRVHERYRQTDKQTTDRRQTIETAHTRTSRSHVRVKSSGNKYAFLVSKQKYQCVAHGPPSGRGPPRIVVSVGSVVMPLCSCSNCSLLLKHTSQNQNIICQQAKISRTLRAKRARSKESVPTHS